MICAIVLAAGQSRRMGAQKMLLPFGGGTVIARVVAQVLESGIAQVFVVVGHAGERVARELAAFPVHVETNPRYREGMLESVRCGLKALPPDCEGILAALGDQPRLTAALIQEMVRSFLDGKKGIVVPVHKGKRGHPLLFSVRYREEILSRYEDEGLRGLLRAHPEDVCELEVEDAATLSDMDCPEDYRRELERLI